MKNTDSISSRDTVLLNSLCAEWTAIDATEPGIAITVRKLAASGLAVFRDGLAVRTEDGVKFMNKGKTRNAESAFECFTDGIHEAAQGAYVPTDKELDAGFVLIDPKRRGSDKSRAGGIFVEAGLVYGRTHGLGADFAPTVADFYRGSHLVNLYTVEARLAAAAAA